MPKRLYPQITRQGPAKLAPHEHLYLSESLHQQGYKPFSRETIAEWHAQMGLARTLPPRLLHQPARNGENHALSIACFVDALLRIDHDAYTFPAGITKILNDEYGHLVFFDPYTVGHIISNLLDVMPAVPKDEAPLGTVQWSGARQLFVRSDSIRTWKWLGAIRAIMGDRATRDQKQARLGDEVPRSEDIWNEIDLTLWEAIE